MRDVRIVDGEVVTADGYGQRHSGAAATTVPPTQAATSAGASAPGGGSPSLPLALSGDGFEAMVTMRTMERVFAVLETGEKIGFGWPLIGAHGARIDRLFARFRAIRDDLVRLRAASTPPQMSPSLAAIREAETECHAEERADG